MVAEELEECVVISSAAVYENPEEQAKMGLMSSGRKIMGQEMHLTIWIINIHHLSDRLAQTIPSDKLQKCV